ncbi:MAG: LexA repressor [Candidatus Roizmanbacteria bacterium GW2011_GWC2_41_7]|uniref:LexA repressor n=1 Tax=Candidatus Roizmanbacteria bacterium GW2011_GWC2_41_7 TaxID=1618487 RepID=A0A0G0XA66_9BACT|nr:MAG: LexA repressor [Candidatus Roizmanbacteria bacterium GW2011_GWC2_41_7]
MANDILTLQEVAEYLKVDERTVHRMLKSKQLPAFKVRNQWRFKKEAIDKWIENSNIEDSKNNKIEVPIIGKVSASLPILAEENVEGTLTVDSSLIKNPDKVFALRVKGTSMINAGIHEGDLVILDNKRTAKPGDIVAALVDNEWTLKYFNRANGKTYLTAANPAYAPIHPKENLAIGGVVVKVIKEYY